jgi:hypothetical protein
MVETVEGRTWQGAVVLGTNAVVVDGTNAVALTAVRRLTFDLPPPPGVGGLGKGNGLMGYYFGRTNFEGSVVVRLDERVDFDWSSAAPALGMPQDHFSVIWSGDVEAPVDGDYVFSVFADDAARLTVSSNVAVEVAWPGRSREASSGVVTLAAGARYPLMLKYQERSGTASVRLYWQGPGMSRRIIPKDRLYAKSRVPGHASDPMSDEGWLSTLYANPDFGGETLTRVDSQIDCSWLDRDPAAGFNRSRYSVRWHGQLRADFTEVYTLHVIGDEPMRVWVEGRPLILPGGQYYMTEVRESLPLVAGERYDVRVEAQSTGGNASMKLMWSSPSTPKAVVPATHVTPASPVVGAAGGADRSGRIPRGVLLRNGTFVGVPVERGNGSTLRAGRWLKNNPISTVNAARIYCQPVSRAMAERIPRGRTGVLLAKGDFADGEFKSLEGSKVTMGSVLFGLKTYDLNKDVLVVVLGEGQVRPSEFEIRLQDQSVLRVDRPVLEAGMVRFRDPALGMCALDLGELSEVRRVR